MNHPSTRPAARFLRGLGLGLCVAGLVSCSGAGQGETTARCDYDRFSIRRATEYGERPAWSPDGERIAFMTKEFGDVHKLDLKTNLISCLTCEGYQDVKLLRVHYLIDGNLVLTGSDREIGDAEARISRTELWFHRSDTGGPPTRLNAPLHEGVAVSRSSRRIAWSLTFLQEASIGGSQLWTGTIEATEDGARLVDRELVYEQKGGLLEAQDFFPGDRGLLFSSYLPDAEVFELDFSTGETVNHSRRPSYDEAEGIFPNGRFAVIESARHDPDASGTNPTGLNLDLYLLRLDGTGTDARRLTTFGEEEGFKASNPVVSPDGRRIAFQRTLNTLPEERLTGSGDGLFLLEFECR